MEEQLLAACKEQGIEATPQSLGLGLKILPYIVAIIKILTMVTDKPGEVKVAKFDWNKLVEILPYVLEILRIFGLIDDKQKVG